MKEFLGPDAKIPAFDRVEVKRERKDDAPEDGLEEAPEPGETKPKEETVEKQTEEPVKKEDIKRTSAKVKDYEAITLRGEAAFASIQKELKVTAQMENFEWLEEAWSTFDALTTAKAQSL